MTALSLACFAAAVSAAPGKTSASIASTPDGRPITKALDQAMVHKYYTEGDFDPAIAILEDFQKTHQRFTRDESVMVYKYLGVMYSADPGTREKGKNYFYKLLKVDPDAKILDMYVSIVVQEIFKNTLDELMGSMPMRRDSTRTDLLGSRGETPPATTGSRPAKQAEMDSGSSHAALWWIGGAAAVVAAGTGFYLLEQGSQKAKNAPDIVADFTEDK